MKVMATMLGVVLAGAIAITAACAQNTASVERGKAAFVEQGCYGCHMVGKFGTPIGPDLSRIGVRYDAAYFTRWLSDPSPASDRPYASPGADGESDRGPGRVSLVAAVAGASGQRTSDRQGIGSAWLPALQGGGERLRHLAAPPERRALERLDGARVIVVQD